MTTRFTLFAALFTLAALAIPVSAMAADGAFVFSVAGGASKAQSKINAKIESSLEPYSFVMRKFAQGRLEDTNKVCATLTFTVKGENLTYDCQYASGKRVTVTTPADGRFHSVKGSDGTSYKLKQKIKADGDVVTITQGWKGEDGLKADTFTYNQSSKKLKQRVRITSPRLDKGDIKYSVRYNQK